MELRVKTVIIFSILLFSSLPVFADVADDQEMALSALESSLRTSNRETLTERINGSRIAYYHRARVGHIEISDCFCFPATLKNVV